MNCVWLAGFFMKDNIWLFKGMSLAVGVKDKVFNFSRRGMYIPKKVIFFSRKQGYQKCLRFQHLREYPLC